MNAQSVLLLAAVLLLAVVLLLRHRKRRHRNRCADCTAAGCTLRDALAHRPHGRPRGPKG